MNSGKAVSVVVAEHGSLWTPWVGRFRMLTPGSVELLVQGADELGAAFAERVRRTTAALVLGGHAIRNAVLVGSLQSKDVARGFRPLVVRSLATASARAGGGQVFLDGPRRDRVSLSAIAEAIGELMTGTGVTVEAQPSMGALSHVA
ncbi:MAG: hypothetical protein R3A78_12270 [Polyangiales bacterium]